MFRKDRMGRRGGGVLLYIKETIPAYEVQLQEEADCNEAICCKLVLTIGVAYRCPNITKQNNEKRHNATSELSKGDCIIRFFLTMGILNGIHYRAHVSMMLRHDLRTDAQICLPSLAFCSSWS